MPFFSFLVRLFFWLVGLGLLATFLFGGFLYIQLEYLYPYRHKRDYKAAEEWNNKHWETGHAIRASISFPVRTKGGLATHVEQYTCYAKQDARAGGLKGPPSKREMPYGEGAFWPEVPLGTNTVIRIDFRDVCRQVLHVAETWDGPVTLEGHRFVHAVGRHTCFLGALTADALDMKRFQVLPLEITALKKIPLRDVITRDIMKPSTHYYSPEYQSLGDSLGWQIDRLCWAPAPNKNCSPDAAKICGTPSR